MFVRLIFVQWGIRNALLQLQENIHVLISKIYGLVLTTFESYTKADESGRNDTLPYWYCAFWCTLVLGGGHNVPTDFEALAKPQVLPKLDKIEAER